MANELQSIVGMFEELYEQASEFINTYKVEILWGSIFIFFIRYLRAFLDDNPEKYFKKTEKGEKFIIIQPRKKWKRIDWASIFLIFVSILIAFASFFENNILESLYGLGLVFNLFISAFLIKMDMHVEIQLDNIKLNGKKINKEKIQSIEVYDDLITVHLLSDKKKDFDLNFSRKNFELVTKMVTALKNFCQINTIPIMDDFEYDIEKNYIITRK
ncbi:MAG: hypothetical protein CMO01_03010 [Thalassobius sp.]|nr:hypothetical protein [Thalassovita sp.]